jgi:hypothetical protein
MSAVKKMDALDWANELEKAEIPTDLFLRVVADTLCTKQALLESENRTRTELKTLELKIAELQMDLSLKIKDLSLEIVEVKKDLSLEIEKIRKKFFKIKAELNIQIAKWVLGVSLLQTTVILSFIRFFPLS